MPPRPLAGRLITAAALVFIGALTLRPAPQNAALAAATPLTCLVCGALGGIDIVLNVLLFVPLGLGLRLMRLSRVQVVVLAALTSGTIEFLQYRFLPGRDASLSDLLTNTLGGITGMVLADHWRAVLVPRPALARRAAVVALAAWIGIQSFAAWALGPSLPRTTYWGQRAPELGQFDQFEGTLLEARLQGDSLPSARLPNSATIRSAMLRGPATLEATIVSGPPTGRLAPIASVFDERQQEIALLGQDGEDLVFRLRTRAADLHLRSPGVRLLGVFKGAIGDTLWVRGALDGRRFTLSGTGSDRHLRRTVSASAAWGWSLIVPLDHYSLGGEAALLTAVWVSALMIPLGYWVAHGWSGTRPTGLPAGLLILAIVIGLAGVSAAFGLPAPQVSEWAGCSAGAVLGWAIATVTRRHSWGTPP